MKRSQSLYKRVRQRRQRVIKIFQRYNWKIEIIHNGYRAWSFEYVVHPPSNAPRGLSRYPKPFTDPTSHRSIKAAIYFGKVAVNECRSPFWLINPYPQSGS